jgi:hypothetical protein
MQNQAVSTPSSVIRQDAIDKSEDILVKVFLMKLSKL